MNQGIAFLTWLGVLLAVLDFAVPARAFYDPSAQRWINRDPIGERGGANLHRFVSNQPADWIDRFGLLHGIPVTTGGEPHPVCKGGKLIVDLGNRQGAVDEKCSKLHELTHIRDIQRQYGENVCANIPDGMWPGLNPNEPAYVEWSRLTTESECNAYRAGRECRRRMLNCGTLTREQKKEVQE
jgi:hypothetical protein